MIFYNQGMLIQVSNYLFIKEPIVSPGNKALVGILIAIGDVIDIFAIAKIFPMEM